MPRSPILSTAVWWCVVVEEGRSVRWLEAVDAFIHKRSSLQGCAQSPHDVMPLHRSNTSLERVTESSERRASRIPQTKALGPAHSATSCHGGGEWRIDRLARHDFVWRPNRLGLAGSWGASQATSQLELAEPRCQPARPVPASRPPWLRRRPSCSNSSAPNAKHHPQANISIDAPAPRVAFDCGNPCTASHSTLSDPHTPHNNNDTTDERRPRRPLASDTIPHTRVNTQTTAASDHHTAPNRMLSRQQRSLFASSLSLLAAAARRPRAATAAAAVPMPARRAISGGKPQKG